MSFPKPSSDPGVQAPSCLLSLTQEGLLLSQAHVQVPMLDSLSTQASTLTWGGLIDPAEEEGPGSQGVGTLILLLHAELAKLGHLLRSHKVSTVSGLLAGGGEAVGRRLWGVAGRAYLG